jgi:uncharacterized protein YlzI (FlbEa/FlbD family)
MKKLLLNSSDNVYNNPDVAMQLHPGYAVVVDTSLEAVAQAILDHPTILEVQDDNVEDRELGVALPLANFRTKETKVDEDNDLDVIEKPARKGRTKDV